MDDKKPSLLSAMFLMRCPSCRKGFVFVNKSIFPLGKCLAIKDNCDHCGQKLVSEKNNGGGINYALTMIVFFLNVLWYWPIFGLTPKDNSWYYFLATSVGVVVLLQPLLMRMSRMIYLYLYVRYGTTRKVYIDDGKD